MTWPKKTGHSLVTFFLYFRTYLLFSEWKWRFFVSQIVFRRILDESKYERRKITYICGFATSPPLNPLGFTSLRDSIKFIPLCSSLWIHRKGDSIMITSRARVPYTRAAVSDITQRATRLPRLLTYTGTCGRTRRRCRRRTCAHHHHRACHDFSPLQRLLDVATLTRGCRSPRWGSRPTCWTPSE